MLELPENELFSAYIDGELTADEQAQVERILDDNPEAQQLVDELRSLSSSLQSLPAYKLDQDLVARVLRQAEQEMLGQPSPATPLPKFHQVEVSEAKSTSWARRLLRPRNFAWSAVAIAVAVFLTLNESGTTPEGTDRVAQRSVTIVPLDVDPVVEAVEAPAVPTVAQAKPDEPKPDTPSPVVPEVFAPATEPTMVAETAPEAVREPSEVAIEPKKTTNPLLVLQCQLADGRIGHEALAELFEQAGVDPKEPISESGGPVEFTLTANQVQQVVSKLQAGTEEFTGFAFLSTSKKAGPRIPSSFGPGNAHREETTSADGNDMKKPGKVTLHVKGTITVSPKAAAPANPAGTTSVEGRSPKMKVTAKSARVTSAKSLPIKSNETYRVRFLLKPAVGEAGTKPQTKAPDDE